MNNKRAHRQRENARGFAAVGATVSKNHEIIAVHHLDASELPARDRFGIKIADSAGELGSAQVADANDFTGGEIAFTTHDSRRQ